jgi:hypothetical protein
MRLIAACDGDHVVRLHGLKLIIGSRPIRPQTAFAVRCLPSARGRRCWDRCSATQHV